MYYDIQKKDADIQKGNQQFETNNCTRKQQKRTIFFINNRLTDNSLL